MKRAGDKFQIVKDAFETPQNDLNAESMKRVRAKRKEQALKALAKAREAIELAEKYIGEECVE